MENPIVTSTFLLLILSFLLGAAAQQAKCAASASVYDSRVIRSEKGVYHVSMPIKVTNIGDCPITTLAVEVDLPHGARIISHWNLTVVERNKLYALTNFRSNDADYLASSANVANAGFVVTAPFMAHMFVTARYYCSSGNNTADDACVANNTMYALPDFSGRKSIDADTQQRLQTASTERDRLQLLSPGDFVFDFSRATKGLSEGTGGRTVAAMPSNWPAVIGHDISMTVGFISACGMNLPHTHPRATEINIVVKGTFQAGVLVENGASFVGNVLTEGMATIFPKGAIHFEQNLNCEPAIFVAAFNSQDPGVQTTASAFFGLPADIAGAALNISSIQTVEDLAKHLPHNPAVALAECKKRCGLE